MTLILASSSATRVRLLKAAGVSFEAVPAHVDEETIKESLLAEGADHGLVASALAELKAIRVSSACNGLFVIGADQVLSFEGRLVSKCGSFAEAARLLTALRGKTHTLISAVALAKDGAIIWRHEARADLRMRDFSDAFLEEYLTREGESLLAGVGCYKIEGLGAQLFSEIRGDNFTIQGLPLLPLLSALRERGLIAV